MIGHSTMLRVPEGLLVPSSTTRFTPGTSLVIRVDIRASSWQSSRVRSAVMASSLDTGRSTTGRGDRSAVPDLLPRLRPEPRSIRAAAEKRGSPSPVWDREVRLQPEQTAELTDLVDHRQAGALLDQQEKRGPGGGGTDSEPLHRLAELHRLQAIEVQRP